MATMVISCAGPPAISLRLQIRGKWLARPTARSLYEPFEKHLAAKGVATGGDLVDPSTDSAVPRTAPTAAWVGRPFLEYRPPAASPPRALRAALAAAFADPSPRNAERARALAATRAWAPPRRAARVAGSLLQRAPAGPWPAAVDAENGETWATPDAAPGADFSTRRGARLRGANVVDPAGWGLGFLADALGPAPVVVLVSRAATFHHYVDGFRDRAAAAAYDTTDRTTAEVREPFLDYARRADRARCYLQTPLCVLNGDEAAPAPAVDFGALAWQPGISPALRARVEAAAAPLARIARTAGFGRLTRSQLFASDAGARSPLHFDQYDNIFCQLAGRKRVWLAPPAQCARRAKTFPVHHPLDAYARDASVDGVDAVVLAPGDALFIPSHWWHAVETLDDGCVSLNFWFSIAAEMAAPPPKDAVVAPFALTELARQVEYLAADMYGPDAVGAFLRDLRADVAGDRSEDRGDDAVACRAYVLAQLAALLGPARVPGFCATFLAPDRATGLGR